MAKILGKDEATYSKEREGFLRDLQHFHDTRGTPIKRIPILGGKEVDLYLLYTLVTSQGGWLRVNSKNNWLEILSDLKVPKGCINASVALKQIYLRYLDRWEKVHFLHEEGDRASDDDEESRHKRWSARTLHSVPYTYNYNQHNIVDSNREYNHLSTDLYKGSDYDRLALSLISPLPNEQDFAINVCTLLSNDGKHTLKFQKHPRIINYLLGHAGVFNHSSLRQLFMHFYSDIRKKPIHNFWKDVIISNEYLDLANETKYKSNNRDTEDSPSNTLVVEDVIGTAILATSTVTPMQVDNNDVSSKVQNVNNDSECIRLLSDSESDDESLVLVPKDSNNYCDNKKLKICDIETDESDLFCIKRSLGTQDYIGQRVLQIATILRNLSFMDENIQVLVKNTSFIRFVLLCCTSRWNILKNLGMDMLGNIASEFIVKDLQNDLLTSNLIQIVTNGLKDQDRACCLSSLEVLNKLSQNEKNEDILLRSLEADIYRCVCSFLTIHDVMLLIYTLECLYSLSSLGERSCHLIVSNHGVIDTLVSLVTVEGKSYGPKACIGMKLVETLPSGTNITQNPNQPQPQQSTQQPGATTCHHHHPPSASVASTNNINNTPIVSTSGNSNSPATPSTAAANNFAVTSRATPAPLHRPPTPSTPARSVSIAPQRILAMTPAPAAPTATICTTASYNIQPSVSQQAVSVTAATSTTTSTTISSSLSLSSTSSSSTPSSSVQHLQVAASQALTPQQLIQQQHAHQQAIHENEQFALAWLRATYEPCLESNKIDHQELYRQYMHSCSKIGRRGVISPLHFPRCVRSVFGGTVGPNPMKPAHPNDPQYYEGIKVRDNPLMISIQSASSPIPKMNSSCTTTASNMTCTTSTTTSSTTPVKVQLHQVRRKSVQQQQQQQHQQTTSAASIVVAKSPTALTIMADTGDACSPVSPASPILKAQLSAPPKQRESVISATPNTSTKGDIKSQAMAHPHLSQALLGGSNTGSSTTTSTLTTMSSASSIPIIRDSTTGGAVGGGQASSTSLIKSLLATKVNDCMSSVSMRTATDCQNVAQVAARQQRLLAQTGNNNTSGPENQQKTASKETPKITTTRLNGARQLFNDNEIGDPSVSSTTQFTSLIKGKKEPPQPPPPPLAPLSNNIHKGGGKLSSNKLVDNNDDSDSLENHSVASSSGIGTVGIGGISSTEDGDNSLTCFEGLLNGMPSMDNPLNEDSNSKDSVKIISSEILINKPLKLADLLEKKFEKSPPLLNGVLGKDVKGEKMDLVENHIEKVLRDNEKPEMILKTEDSPIEMITTNLKRSASDEILEVEAKRPLLSSSASNNINGSTNVDSPDPDSVSSSNGDEAPATVSTAAAKLFADIAADILEDEDEEQLLQEAQAPSQIPQLIEQPAASAQIQLSAGQSMQQIIVDNNQQVLLTQPRQIIVSQGQITAGNQVVINTGTPMKTQTGQTVIVQNAGGGQRPMMLQQANTGQFIMSSGLQGQVQLVASSHQPGQYVLQTGGSQGAYVVAQPQTAVVHGQPQTVLVAQTAQQQGSPAKTIIILQPQSSPSQATHHQKVVVTPQGQQVVVTQVPRPIAQSSTVSNINNNNNNTATTPVNKIVKTVSTSTSVTQTITTNGVSDKKKEDTKPKKKITRDLSTPFVCEWGDCNIETKFKSANEVYLHACATHCPIGNEEVICLWDRCDNLKRKRYSLMTHLNDKHCNTEVMKQALIKRKQAAQGTKVETAPPPPSNNHPGYAPDAALHAIKRHALEFVNPKELQDDNEGPVTKSIRLTASLILRNLVIYSSQCKRYLKSYESHLANVALSNVESSRTIAQVLYDMNDGSTHR